VYRVNLTKKSIYNAECDNYYIVSDEFVNAGVAYENLVGHLMICEGMNYQFFRSYDKGSKKMDMSQEGFTRNLK